MAEFTIRFRVHGCMTDVWVQVDLQEVAARAHYSVTEGLAALHPAAVMAEK
jgi:hypothetical protein